MSLKIFIDKYKTFNEEKNGTVIDLNKNFRSRKPVLDSVNYIFKQIMTEECGGADYAKSHKIESNQIYDNAYISDNRNLELLAYHL